MNVAHSQQRTHDEIEAAAQQLQDLWGRLASTHTMIGGGCSCGVGSVAVALGDFEQDIVDYVQAEAERNRRTDVLALLDSAAREGERWSISRLLSRFAGRDATFDACPAQFILERLTGTLRSFDKLHGGR